MVKIMKTIELSVPSSKQPMDTLKGFTSNIKTVGSYEPTIVVHDYSLKA